MKPQNPSPDEQTLVAEVRFSLRDMLAEVESELMTGAFGQQKLRQEEVRKIFAVRRRSKRAKRN